MIATHNIVDFRNALLILSIFFASGSLIGQKNSLDGGRGHDVGQYGALLSAIAQLGSGPGMSVDIQGSHAYVVGEGALTVVNIDNPKEPRVVGKLENLGTTRQIQVRDDIAYIVSRGDGMYIVDVSNPLEPTLLSKYDTIEFATGLALGGDIAFLACRLYGVELVDISDPENPEHISVSRTGVSQSVVYADGYIYVGVWAEQVVAVVDVSDPWNPVITDRLELDGYGDGVAVYQGHLYAATGQHSRARPDNKPGDPGFGTGHGLEIFSLADPAHPRLVSRTKFPQDDHTDSHLWTVRVTNDHAFVVDNYNGLFVLNVSDPVRPTPVGQHQLPYYEARKGSAVVSGLAVTRNLVVLTSPYMDARLIDAQGLAREVSDWTGETVTVGPRPTNSANEHYQANYLGGQVYSLVTDGILAYVAAGQGGLQVVSLYPEFNSIRQHKTVDRVMDVKIRKNLLFVAEGMQGLGIYKENTKGDLVSVGRYDTKGESANQVVIPGDSDFAVIMVGPHSIHIVDISDPTAPEMVFREYGQGILTGDNIANGLFSGRYVGVYWHKSGHYHKPTDRIRWYDLKRSGGPAYVDETTLGRIKTANGVEVAGNKLLVIGHKGYRLLNALDTRSPEKQRVIRVPGHDIIGKPTLSGDRLFVSHRAGGEIWEIDVQDFDNPRLIKKFVAAGNPARIVAHENRLLVPGGYEGLLVSEEILSKKE